MDSQILVYLVSKILFGNKRKQTTDIPKAEVHIEWTDQANLSE